LGNHEDATEEGTELGEEGTNIELFPTPAGPITMTPYFEAILCAFDIDSWAVNEAPITGCRRWFSPPTVGSVIFEFDS
jgi:hypothetical protein